MVVWAHKNKKNKLGIVVYHKDGLYYIRITNSNILVYGKTIDEASNELGEVLDHIIELSEKGEDISSFFRKDTLIEKLEYCLGRIFAFLHRLFKGSNKNIIQKLDDDMKIFNHAWLLLV